MSDARRTGQSDLARLRLANIRSFAATCQPEISQLQSAAVKRFSGIGPSKAHLQCPPSAVLSPGNPLSWWQIRRLQAFVADQTIRPIAPKAPAFAGMDDDDSEAW